MGHALRTAAVVLAAALPLPLAAQDLDTPQPISTVTREQLDNLPGTPVKGLLETVYTGLAVFDPTSIAANARANYFIDGKLAITGSATAAHIDLGFDDFTAIEVLVGPSYHMPIGNRATVGVLAALGLQAGEGDSDGLYNLGAFSRYAVFPAAALYTGVFYKGAFGGGHIWSAESHLVPGKYPGLEGMFTPRRGLWEVNFNAQYQFDPGDFLDLAARAAPFITDRFQVGADFAWSRDDTGFDTFTQTNIEAFAAYHFPMDSRILPYLGAFGGYQSFTGFDGEGTFGGRGGLKISCTPTSSVFFEGEYRSFTGEFSDGQFGLRLGTNIYAGF
jgi:hypothetical protein